VLIRTIRLCSFPGFTKNFEFSPLETEEQGRESRDDIDIENREFPTHPRSNRDAPPNGPFVSLGGSEALHPLGLAGMPSCCSVSSLGRTSFFVQAIPKAMDDPTGRFSGRLLWIGTAESRLEVDLCGLQFHSRW